MKIGKWELRSHLMVQLNTILREVAILKQQNTEKDQQIQMLAQQCDKAQYYLDHPEAPQTPPPKRLKSLEPKD